MRVVLQNSLCDNCNRVYKQKKIVGDDTYYCQENECIYRKISYPKTSTSQNKESINNIDNNLDEINKELSKFKTCPLCGSEL